MSFYLFSQGVGEGHGGEFGLAVQHQLVARRRILIAVGVAAQDANAKDCFLETGVAGPALTPRSATASGTSVDSWWPVRPKRSSRQIGFGIVLSGPLSPTLRPVLAIHQLAGLGRLQGPNKVVLRV